MAEPVAWFLIEKHWTAVGSDGKGFGKVEEVLGDTSLDIFSGLVVGTGLLHRPRYVPAELVSEIVEGRVTLSIGKDEFTRLEEYEKPPPKEG
ncbi:MAG TPA: hypothetical protein VHQ98_03615 [Gaiellaceae bacterium]|nr:hypothetical protein [Gaiellaceae bacterium]